MEDAGYTPSKPWMPTRPLAFCDRESDIALLFTDIQMPGSMDGLELAHAAYECWPQLKIILVSGQLKLSCADIPRDSRFFGKPLVSGQIIAEMQDMIGLA